MDNTRTQFVSVRFSPSEKQDLCLLALAAGMKPSELIRTIIRERKEEVAGAGNGQRGA